MTNVEVLSRAGLPTMYTLLRERHVRRMEVSRIPKDILHGELATGQKSIGRSYMRALNINTESWEDLAADCGSWRNTFQKQLKLGEEKLIVMADEQ